MNFYKFLIISILVACFFPLFPGAVLAQGTGIKISPLRIEELVDPGEVLEKSIKITNVSDSPKTFYPFLKDFTAGGETGQVLLISPGSQEGYFMSSWVGISPDGINFAPGEEKEIPIKIKVPDTAGPGGYYGAVVFGSIPPKIEEGGVVIVVAQQTGVLVLLQVAGDVIEEARIREFTTDRNSYSTPFKVNFVTRVENLGNVHLKPHGLIEIKSILGKKVATLRVNDSGANVLPNSIRRFENSWEGDFGFGRYTATLSLSFGTFAYEGGQGRQTLYAQRTFWIIPWKMIIPIFLGLIFVGALFALFLKLYKDRAIEKTLKEAGLRRMRYVRKYEGPSPALYLGLIILIILILVFLIGGFIFFLFFA